MLGQVEQGAGQGSVGAGVLGCLSRASSPRHHHGTGEGDARQKGIFHRVERTDVARLPLPKLCPPQTVLKRRSTVPVPLQAPLRATVPRPLTEGHYRAVNRQRQSKQTDTRQDRTLSAIDSISENR